MGFIDWIQNNWYAMAEGVGYLVLFATVAVGFADGPKADRAKTVLDRVMGLLRQIGIGTFKDEPGTLSIPGAPDTGKRITAVE
jgi:hypothetical protein